MEAAIFHQQIGAEAVEGGDTRENQNNFWHKKYTVSGCDAEAEMPKCVEANNNKRNEQCNFAKTAVPEW